MDQPRDPYETLLLETAVRRERLLSHRIYPAVRDPAALRVFMSAHVFAVWDFMSLLKALQRQLTCVDVPWVPPRSRVAGRLINDIVLGEESDEVQPGLSMSHFELYLQSMQEVRADVAPIESFVSLIRAGMDVPRALEKCGVGDHVRAFVGSTLALARSGQVEEVAASFLLGREQLVPAMFRRLLPSIEMHQAASLRLYIARHIEIDEQSHGPLAERLLRELCGTDADRWGRATRAAQKALFDRCALWDGVADSIEDVVRAS